jgi:uncharacterized protein YlxP (DUF503 family)
MERTKEILETENQDLKTRLADLQLEIARMTKRHKHELEVLDRVVEFIEKHKRTMEVMKKHG